MKNTTAEETRISKEIISKIDGKGSPVGASSELAEQGTVEEG